jgi:2'-5' RNA ligase
MSDLSGAASRESLRCFIAAELPEAATESVREAQARLRCAEPNWKWVDPGTFHITLKFLGQVERERLDATWRSVRAAIDGTTVSAIALRGLGVFPNLRAPRVAWAGVSEGAAELAALAAKVEEACSQHGFEREKRPFAAHLTLGRAREPGPSLALGSIIGELAETAFGGGKIDKVVLMESRLQRTGAVYTAVGEQLLQCGDTA